jgi:endonuclease YncB( thermonuclease family)
MDKWDHTLFGLLISLIFLFTFTSVSRTDFTGEVVGVIDGDTIDVLNVHHAERIRLRGIDWLVCHNSEW